MRTCSECGRKFFISYNDTDYKYKVNGFYQCSYTCYDHALIRLSHKRYVTDENYIEYVKKSEKAMATQGKTILTPITIKCQK